MHLPSSSSILHVLAKMSKICDIDESGDVLATYTGNEKDGLKVVSLRLFLDN